jgi:hypothetical protein
MFLLNAMIVEDADLNFAVFVLCVLGAMFFLISALVGRI